jgi:hypothetical protein
MAIVETGTAYPSGGNEFTLVLMEFVSLDL